MRLNHGADGLPYLKELKYYEGAKRMWQFFERYQGDEFMINLALLGMLDPTNHDHLQTALETRTA